jgi:DedD protein
MGLLSVFKRRADAAPGVAETGGPGDAVQQARTRARQRLIGAVVLVAIGIVGFPLVFETQPRPVPVDTPIEIARKDGAAPVIAPAARTPVAPPPVAAAPRDDVITESAAEAGRELPAAKTADAASAAPGVAAPNEPAAKVAAAPKPAPKASAEPARKPTPPAEPQAEAARAKALLDAAPVASAEARFVVQVGEFAEAAAARETRLKVEKLGLKTYTQVAQTAGGSRIRVRVGPFGTRDEADKVVAKARAAGITAVVLTL